MCVIENDCECLYEIDLFKNDWYYNCDKSLFDVMPDVNTMNSNDNDTAELNDFIIINLFIKFDVIGGDQVYTWI